MSFITRVILLAFLILPSCLFSASYVEIQTAEFDFLQDTFSITALSDATEDELVIAQYRYIDINGIQQISEPLYFTFLQLDTQSGTSTWTINFDLPNGDRDIDYRLCIQNDSELLHCTEYVSSTVPARLGYFEVVDERESVLIRWSTTFECFASHFEIERSFDNRIYEILAEVETEGGGISCIGADYELIDLIQTEQVQASKIYYRIKMYNTDGSFFFSNVLSILAKESPFLYYDQITKSLLVENFETNTLLTIVGVDGKLYFNQSLENNSMELYDLPRGLYIIQANDSLHSISMKVYID